MNVIAPILRILRLPRAAAWLLAMALAGLAVGGEPSGAAAEQKVPQLVVSEPSHDFGVVTQGQVLEHAFTLTNSGNAVLEITEVKPACGCTTTGDWPHSLQPGESGTIPVRVETMNFMGPISKTIAVTTNCPAHPEVVLEVRARIWTPVSVLTPVLLFPAVSDPTQPATRATTIRNETDSALRLSDLQSENPLFKPVLKEIVPGREFELVVSTVPPLPEGTQTSRITLKSSSDQMPTITVQAIVTVLPAIQIAPSEFALRTLRLETAEKRYAVVLNHRGADLKVSDVTTNAPGVQLSTTSSPDRKQVTIALTFPAGFEIRPTDRFALRGKTNQPSTPEFEIPITFAGSR